MHLLLLYLSLKGIDYTYSLREDISGEKVTENRSDEWSNHPHGV